MPETFRRSWCSQAQKRYVSYHIQHRIETMETSHAYPLPPLSPPRHPLHLGMGLTVSAVPSRLVFSLRMVLDLSSVHCTSSPVVFTSCPSATVGGRLAKRKTRLKGRRARHDTNNWERRISLKDGIDLDESTYVPT
jgi:hypothetical protein